MNTKLNCTERQTLHLLRCALWGGEPETCLFPLDTTDWQAIIDLSVRHTVHGLVASEMKRVAEELGEEGLAMSCLQIVMQTGRANTVMDGTLSTLEAALKEGGFGGYLLKGQGVGRCYREPALRVCGDIDWYTGARTEEVAAWLTGHCPGFRLERSGNEGKHKGAKLGDVEVELHRRADNPDGTEGGRRLHEWVEAQLNPGPPTPTFHAVYVFHHLLHHFLREGVALRQVCDWMRCLYAWRADIDEGELTRLLADFRLTGPWRLLGAVAVRHLGMPAEAMPLYNNKVARWRSNRLLRLLLDSSNFGEEQKQAFERKLDREGWWKHRWQSACHYTSFYGQRALLFPRHGGRLLWKYYVAGAKNFF